MSSLNIPLSEVQLSKKKKKKEKGVAAAPNAANDLDMPPLPDVKKKKGAAGAQPRAAAALSSEAKLDLPLDALQKAGKKRTASAANLDKSVDEIKKANHLEDAAFRQALTEQGFTLAAFRKDMRKQILRLKTINNAVRSRLSLTEEDLKAQYEQTVRQSGAHHALAASSQTCKARSSNPPARAARIAAV